MTLDLDAPQIGEHVWHAFTADTTIASESALHRERIETVIARYRPDFDWRHARLLEVGAYRHFAGHLLAAERGCEYIATDISASALRDGRAQSKAQGLAGTATLVVADFHDLPFSTSYFDAVFVAASVHHTRQPEIVLREMLRVTKPGGLLIVYNEPCARALCFHAFASNRAESLTPFEARLNDAKLLPTLSSPFWGTRPEHLFGMVENDRIPLSLYMDEFARAGTVVERALSFHGLTGPLENALLALGERGDALRAKVRELLRSAVESVEQAYGETERLLGYRQPTECEVHALANVMARLIEQRPRPPGDEEWRAEAFGAALSAVVRKHAGDATPATTFRRVMATESDGLVREADSELARPLLPDLPTCEDGALLEPWFPREDWRWIHGADGVRSMANLAAQCRVEVAPQPARTLLLIRYFAVVTDGRTYKVRVWGAGRLLAEHLVVLQESRLVRTWCPPDCAEIVIEVCTDDDTPLEAPWRIRVGVFQQFDVG